MTDIKLTHSYSSIKMYENCPKRYYHQRIMKEIKDEGSEATRYGERIHSDLEHRLVNNKPLTDETKQYEVLELTLYLEMNQLDLTQLNIYTNDDIQKRLNYIDLREAM